jgi:ferritin-like metal-binding protein YciE
MASENMGNLEDLFVHTLQDIYSAEQQIINSLPKMSEAASSPLLQEAFDDHLDQTRVQVERLEEVFKSLGNGVKPGGTKCKGMEGLIEEGKEVMKMKGDPAVLDAALIAAAQRVEHYEIAAYGCARTYAEQLGYEDAADLLQETLEEEEETDERLTELAESTINPEAEEGEDEEEEEEEE